MVTYYSKVIVTLLGTIQAYSKESVRVIHPHPRQALAHMMQQGAAPLAHDRAGQGARPEQHRLVGLHRPVECLHIAICARYTLEACLLGLL